MKIRFLRKLARYQAINWPLFWWCRIQRFLRTSFRRRPLRFTFSRRRHRCSPHSIPFHVCPSPLSWPSPKPKYFSPTLESIPITNIRFARYHLSLPPRDATDCDGRREWRGRMAIWRQEFPSKPVLFVALHRRRPRDLGHGRCLVVKTLQSKPRDST